MVQKISVSLSRLARILFHFIIRRVTACFCRPTSDLRHGYGFSRWWMIEPACHTIFASACLHIEGACDRTLQETNISNLLQHKYSINVDNVYIISLSLSLPSTHSLYSLSLFSANSISPIIFLAGRGVLFLYIYISNTSFYIYIITYKLLI